MRYSDELSKLLEDAGAKEGALILLTTEGKEYKGTLMPNKDSSDPDVVVIKLRNGYNIGLRVVNGSVKVLEQPVVKNTRTTEHKPKEGLPNLVLIGTGGTIGSKAGGISGALTPGLSTANLIDMMPEILDVANIKARDLTATFSENMDVKNWQEMAVAVEEELNNGADGIIISHGTDTMGYTAAALSFMLRELKAPVVIVGSQRSPDRPSSDAPGNIMASVRFCVSSNAPGVYVIMHDTMNDDSYAVHRGTRVRKMHTSRRDAFRSVNAIPVAQMDPAFNITFRDEVPIRSERTKAYTKMETNVTLLQFYPGMDPEVFRKVITDSKGVVIAGSGLGHVSDSMASVIKEATDKGTIVVMTSQCINGPTGLNIYETGRYLQSIGVISVMDMLPETAYVKLMWTLANTKNKEEAKDVMKKCLSYEMGERRTVDVIW